MKYMYIDKQLLSAKTAVKTKMQTGKTRTKNKRFYLNDNLTSSTVQLFLGPYQHTYRINLIKKI